MRLTGLNAMDTSRSRQTATGPRLVKGAAFADTTQAVNAPDDWPVYRGDPGRSGCTVAAVPAQLKTKGQVDLGASMTPPTVADGRILVACPDQHRVQALDRSSGAPAWDFVAGSRVDSAPTVHAGRALFGSRDGHVYLCRLNPRTGELLSETPTLKVGPMTSSTSSPEQSNHLPGARSDILVSDGNYLYLRDMAFTKEGAPVKAQHPHLFTLTSFLDGSWPHRSYWIFGTDPIIARGSGNGGLGGDITQGRLLLTAKDHIYGYGRITQHWSNAFRDEAYHLFKRKPDQGKKRGRMNCVWSIAPPMRIRAMLLAGDVIFAAGPIIEDPLQPTDGKSAILAAFAAADGKELSRMPLPAQPVFDGMAAAGGELFLTLEGGKVLCLAGTK